MYSGLTTHLPVVKVQHVTLTIRQGLHVLSPAIAPANNFSVLNIVPRDTTFNTCRCSPQTEEHGRQVFLPNE